MAKLPEVVPLPSTLLDWAGIEQLLGLFDVAGGYAAFGQGDIAEIKVTFREARLNCFGFACAVCLVPGLPRIVQRMTHAFPGLSRLVQRMIQADAIRKRHGNPNQ